MILSGYDRDNWTLRDEKRHRGDVDTVREQVTKSGTVNREIFALKIFCGVNFRVK